MRSVSTWILVVALAIAGYYAWEQRRDGGAAVEAASIEGAAEGSRPTPSGAPTPSSAGLAGPRRPAPSAAAAWSVAGPASQPGAGTSGEPAGIALTPSGALAARVHGYRQRARSALAAGERAYAAAYGQGWLHAAPEGCEEAAAGADFLVGLERAAVEGANEAARASDPSAQRVELTVACLAATDAARRAVYRDILDQLAQTEVLSGRPSADAMRHAVAPGESLAKIAGRYGIPVEALQRINGLGASTAIRAGQTLSVPKGPVELIVVKADFRLALLANGRLLREYAVGIGKDDSTPEASFAIGEKQVNPVWYSPKGAFGPNDERNILGSRWLGFVDQDEHKGFGIHGTRLPESIGKAESSGCIRLRNADVEDLYAFVPRGAKVTIVR
jgi:LysM repeat protein